MDDNACINALEAKFINDHKNRKDFEITNRMLFYLRRAATIYLLDSKPPELATVELSRSKKYAIIWKLGTFSKTINRALVRSEDWCDIIDADSVKDFDSRILIKHFYNYAERPDDDDDDDIISQTLIYYEVDNPNFAVYM